MQMQLKRDGTHVALMIVRMIAFGEVILWCFHSAAIANPLKLSGVLYGHFGDSSIVIFAFEVNALPLTANCVCIGHQ